MLEHINHDGRVVWFESGGEKLKGIVTDVEQRLSQPHEKMVRLRVVREGVVKDGAPLYMTIEESRILGPAELETPVPDGEWLIRELLRFIGEDPKREGLLETPKRVARAWAEWAWGYGQDPKHVLKTFQDGATGANELVIVHNIPIVSKCEHHLADIVGHAHIGYIPNGKIVGLSKLARLSEIFARRLQVQERLTNQIADALQEHLEPTGVGVLIRAHHGCMSTRGVKIHGSTTTTSAMRGVLLTEGSARAEFMSLCKMAEDAK